MAGQSLSSGVPPGSCQVENSPTPITIEEIEEGENSTDQNEARGTKRALTSEVWNSFKRQNINGKWKAICNFCSKTLGGETKNGTKYLHDHLKRCRLKSATDIRQSFLRASKNVVDGKPNLETYTFNQDDARKEIAYMIALHEFPLSIVNHIGFQRFVAALQPRFNMVSRSTITRDVINIYNQEKTRIMKLLEENQCRISITSDMWTSNQKRGYMVITAHYIDNSWTLQSRIISFMNVPCPHTSKVIAKTLMKALMDWKIDRKLSTITLDNCSTNDAMIDLLLGKLPNDSLWLDGTILHMRCSAHILNLIVKDGLDEIGDGIERIRDSVSYWTATPKRLEKFEEMARILDISTSKKLDLDCKTRWNSTYKMLDVALHYQDVFSRLITELFSGTKYPTANTFFPKVCQIKLALKEWLVCGDTLIENLAKIMIEKFDKYWRDVHGVLAIATILDPRYKMELVEFYFVEIYGDEASEEIKKVSQLCHDLVSRYEAKHKQSGKKSLSSMTNVSTSSLLDNDFAPKFQSFLASKGSNTILKSELDAYLGEGIIPIEVNENFNILNWWKTVGARYPMLQKLARDVYGIPISTVASESAFSIGGRVISPHRSRLKPSTIEALMCMRDWLQTDLKGSSRCEQVSTLLEDFDVDDDVGEVQEK